MNKRFMKISLGIFLFLAFSLLGFKFIFGNKKIYSDGIVNVPDSSIRYEGFEEDEENYIIKISFKNNSKYYGIIREAKLQFQRDSKHGFSNNTGPIFEGYDLKSREYFDNYKDGEEVYSPFLNPYDKNIYFFEIPKGLSFDEKVFDTNRIIISYNIEYLKYKTKNNAVTGRITTKGGFEFLNNSLYPYRIQ